MALVFRYIYLISTCVTHVQNRTNAALGLAEIHCQLHKDIAG